MIGVNIKVTQEQSTRSQYLTASIVNLLTMAFGFMEGWVSPSIILLTSNETPFPSGPITMEEASWVACLMPLGCLFGNICFGYITNKFGRKLPLILITVPIIISWLLVFFATNVYYLYAARIINGFFGGGGYQIVPLLLSEIANDRVRGTLVSTLVLTENFGILLAFIFGNYFDFHAAPKLAIALIILFAALLSFFPESPTFLLKQNKISEAERSIRFYQNLREGDKDNKLIEHEISRLKRNIHQIPTDKSSGNHITWSDLKTDKVKKAMTIGLVLVILNQFSGIATMLSYSGVIFQEVGSYMSPNMSSIVVGVIQMFGTLIATHLVDRAGRKFLFAVSNIGSAIGLTIMGVYMMLKSWGVSIEAFNWVPVMSFSFVIFIASIAILSIPILVISEVMPEKVKDFCVSICLILLWLFSFFITKYLPLMTDTIGFHGSMYLFAGLCVACEIFIVFCLPETKGKSHEEIMDSLRYIL